MNLWRHIRGLIFPDPDQISSLRTLFRMIVFQFTLLCVSIIFGFIFIKAISPLVRSFSLSVIFTNVIYHVVMLVADIGGEENVTYTASVSDDDGSDPGEWKFFTVLRVWYAVLISAMTAFFYNFIFN